MLQGKNIVCLQSFKRNAVYANKLPINMLKCEPYLSLDGETHSGFTFFVFSTKFTICQVSTIVHISVKFQPKEFNIGDYL